MPGQRAGFAGHAFLQAAVPGQADNPVVENAVLGGVETRFRHLARHGQSDRVGHALAQRTGGALHAGRFAELRMTGRDAAELTEIFHLLERHIVAGEMEPAVEEHAAVAGGENKAVAVEPARLGRIVTQGRAEKHRADFRASQGQTQVTGLAGGNGVNGQAPRIARGQREDIVRKTHEDA